MTIVPMLLAALFVVGVALFGVLMSGRSVAQSPIPRWLTPSADLVIGVAQLVDPPARTRPPASGSKTRSPQALAGARPRLPGLTRTRPLSVIGPVMRRPPPSRRLPTNIFSDES